MTLPGNRGTLDHTGPRPTPTGPSQSGMSPAETKYHDSPDRVRLTFRSPSVGLWEVVTVVGRALQSLTPQRESSILPESTGMSGPPCPPCPTDDARGDCPG